MHKRNSRTRSTAMRAPYEPVRLRATHDALLAVHRFRRCLPGATIDFGSGQGRLLRSRNSGGGPALQPVVRPGRSEHQRRQNRSPIPAIPNWTERERRSLAFLHNRPSVTGPCCTDRFSIPGEHRPGRRYRPAPRPGAAARIHNQYLLMPSCSPHKGCHGTSLMSPSMSGARTR